MVEGTCFIDGCGLPTRTHGWCNSHYQRWYRTGDAEYKAPPRVIAACSEEGCDRPVSGRGWCRSHYARWWRGTKHGQAVRRKHVAQKKSCSFDGCTGSAGRDGLCQAHGKQHKKGKSLAPLQRRTDPTARDEEGRKLCGTCRLWLPERNFTRSVSRADGFAALCSQCNTSKRLQRKFGITLDHYEHLLAQQEGGCAVCGKSEKDNGRRLAVDHDHACCPGQFTCGRCLRGLLCSSCNLHLGAIGDSIKHIESMAAYLRSAQVRSG